MVAWTLKGPQSCVGRTPLHYSANLGQIDATELLLRYSDLQARDMHGMMPLHLAATNGHVALCQMLLSHGAPVDGRDKVGGCRIVADPWLSMVILPWQKLLLQGTVLYAHY